MEIIISYDNFFNDNNEPNIDFINILLENSKNIYYIISKMVEKTEELAEALNFTYDVSCFKKYRRGDKHFPNFDFIIGNKNVDFFIATSKQKIIFYDLNKRVIQDKVRIYGIGFDIAILKKIFKIAKLSEKVYFRGKINSNTEVFSLIDAQSKKTHMEDERKMIDNFHSVLKNGDTKNKYYIFLYILFAIQNLYLEKIDYIFYYPSSNTDENQQLLELVEKLRNIFHIKIHKVELLKRIVSVTPSKCLSQTDRLSCKRHLESIIINEEYVEDLLKGKNFLIIDDYCTNGTSFETVKNLLNGIEYNKLYCLSIGKFKGQNYIVQDYTKDSLGNWKLARLCQLDSKNSQINMDTKTDIDELFRVIFSE